MTILHHHLCQKFHHYHRWHQHPLHKHVHWGLLGAVALGVALSFVILGWSEVEVPVVHVARAQSPSCTRYVATNGSDSNTGTEAQPWKTLQKAADSVNPGDVVCVKAGIYNEMVTIKKSGQPGNPIIFEGERGLNGEWNTIIDGGNPFSGWLASPEIGNGVYKTNNIGYNPKSMTIDNKLVARINDSYMASGTGFDYLRKPASETVTVNGVILYFWDGIEVLYGYLNGVTYIRFRNGDNPNEKNIKVSPGGGGILIKDKSYIVVRRFLIRGAQNAIHIEGSGATHNIIEENYLTNGHNRVYIYNGPSYNHVRSNEMTINYYGHDDFGAWDGGSGKKYALREYLYSPVFKYIVGDSASDDRGVQIDSAGPGNEIYENHIFQGLIGVWAGYDINNETRDLKVYNNVIHNFSSIGILPLPWLVNAEFFNNLVYDNNINLRLHQYDEEGDTGRLVYIYRNRFYQPPGVSEDHIYVSPNTSGPMPPNTEHPTFWLYHNSFSGGNIALMISMFVYDKGGLLNTRFINNLFSSPRQVAAVEGIINGPNMVDIFDYNWVGGTAYYGSTIPAWFGSHNILATGQQMWDDASISNFQLPASSPARNAGVDLSRSFTIDGKSFPALPGMTLGYAGADGKPDMGAVQSEGDGGCIPSTETCDQKDNDCDGNVDEGNVCGTTNQPPRNLRLRYLGPTPTGNQQCTPGGNCSVGTCPGTYRCQNNQQVCQKTDPNCGGQANCTHYASPAGGGNGTLFSSPFQIVDFWSVASPGKTLCLLDGTYRGDRSMINPPENLNGTAGSPITVRALNDGNITIDGENARRPVYLRYNDYFILEGFNAHSGSWYVVEVSRGADHNIVRRVVAWDANKNQNVMVFGANYNSDNLFEDIAGWGWGRKIIETFSDTNTTLRRCFFRWSGHTHAGGTYRLGTTFSYDSTNTLHENCIGTWDMLPESMDSPENLAVFGFDRDGGGGHRVLGSIGYLVSGQKRLPYFIYFGPGDSRLDLEAKDIFAYSDLPGVETAALGQVPKLRYVNGTLTNIPLWPWPMNERIKQAMVESGYDQKGGLDGKGGTDLMQVLSRISNGQLP